MSVEVTETMAGMICSAMSAKDGRMTETVVREAEAGAVWAAAGAGALFWAEAQRVRSRLPARIIPKTTAAARRADRETTLVFVRISSFMIRRPPADRYAPSQGTCRAD